MAGLLTGAVAGGLAFTLFQIVFGMLLPPTGLPAEPPHVLPWMIVANLVMAGVLSWIARGSRLHGMRLVLMLYVVAMAIGEVSSLVEAVFFGIMTVQEVLSIVPNTLVPALLGVMVVVWVTRTWTAPAVPATSPPFRWGRLVSFGAIGTVLYLVCYFIAGLLVLPFVKDFYASKGLMPAPGMVLGVELLIRGPMFVAAVAWLARALPGTRASHALAGAIAMSTIGGIVPLIVPNSVMPDAIRFAHFVEVVTSNFVFGGIAGWLMSPARAILPAPSEETVRRSRIVSRSGTSMS